MDSLLRSMPIWCVSSAAISSSSSRLGNSAVWPAYRTTRVYFISEPRYAGRLPDLQHPGTLMRPGPPQGQLAFPVLQHQSLNFWVAGVRIEPFPEIAFELNGQVQGFSGVGVAVVPQGFQDAPPLFEGCSVQHL